MLYFYCSCITSKCSVFFYLKKDYQENVFPNIISTNVKYNNNIITVRYILNEPNLNHNNF